jgi:hypothetical protein
MQTTTGMVPVMCAGDLQDVRRKSYSINPTLATLTWITSAQKFPPADFARLSSMRVPCGLSEAFPKNACAPLRGQSRWAAAILVPVKSCKAVHAALLRQLVENEARRPKIRGFQSFREAIVNGCKDLSCPARIAPAG